VLTTPVVLRQIKTGGGPASYRSGDIHLPVSCFTSLAVVLNGRFWQLLKPFEAHVAKMLKNVSVYLCNYDYHWS